MTAPGSTARTRCRRRRAARIKGNETDFALRFHLHPSVKASRLSDARGVMLVLPNRDVWTFEALDDKVDLEDSVFLAGNDGPRRTAQIVIRQDSRQRLLDPLEFRALDDVGLGHHGPPQRPPRAGIAAVKISSLRGTTRSGRCERGRKLLTSRRLARLATLDGAPSGSARISAARLGKSIPLTKDLPMTDHPRRVTRALLSVSDKTGLIEFATRAGRPRRRTGLHRRHRQGDRGGGAEGHGRLRPHRLSGNDGRPGQDPASEGAWRPARDPRQQGTCRGDEGARHRADRPSGGQSLSVRSHRRQRRRLRGLHREHRHRRPGDDPRRGEESRRRRRRGRSRGLSGRARRTRRQQGRDHAGAAPPPRRQGLCAHRRL